MENLKTKQDIMLDKINETKTLLKKLYFILLKRKFQVIKIFRKLKFKL